MNASQPILILATLSSAIRMVRSEWRALLQIILVPMLLTMVLTFPLVLKFHAAATPEEAQLLMKENAPWVLLAGILTAFIHVWMQVGVLRFFLLNEHPNGWVPEFKPQVWQTILKNAQIFFVYFLAMTVAFLVGLLLSAVFLTKILAVVVVALEVGFIMYFFGARLCLAPTAAALGQNASLRHSWKTTSGQVLRLCAIWFVLGIFVGGIMLAIGLTDALIIKQLPEFIQVGFTFVKSFVVGAGSLAMSTAISALIYAHFVHGEPEVVHAE